jgi:hypothetical protein
VAQELLLGKHEALSSNSTSTKKEKKKEREDPFIKINMGMKYNLFTF